MGYKTENNKRSNKTNKQKLIAADRYGGKRWGKEFGGKVEEGIGGQICSDRRRRHFGS